MSHDLMGRGTALFLALALLTFSGTRSVEILHPLEEAVQDPHQQHPEEVLENSFVHEAHFCAHLQKLELPWIELDAFPLGISPAPMIELVVGHQSLLVSSIRSRGPPQLARS